MCEEWWWKRCVNRLVVVGKLYHGERGRALHGADGYDEKAGSEGKGGGSLHGEMMSGRTTLFRCRRCRVLSSGRKDLSCSADEWRSSVERIHKCGWVEGRTACKEKPHTAIRVETVIQTVSIPNKPYNLKFYFRINV